MPTKSHIEWTEFTWNPTTGCTKISPGCKNCYAEKMALRLQAMGEKSYQNGFRLTLQPDRLDEPLRRKRPAIYFVNSMSDLFHEAVPFDYIDRIMVVIIASPQHIYQILTKRPERMRGYFLSRCVPHNVWLGTSIEDRKYGLPRIDILRSINVKIRFLSIEPLLEDLGKIDLTGIKWVIVGGESGAKARQMQKSWVLSVKEQCFVATIPFFFKQWGAYGEDGKKRSKQANGRMLDGMEWCAMPELVGDEEAQMELF